MAEPLPGFEPPHEGPLERNWHTYDNYRVVHEHYMDALGNEGIVVSHDLTFVDSPEHSPEGVIQLLGIVITASGAVLDVDKLFLTRLEPGHHLEVLTNRYIYNARVVESGLTLFRYDNCHGDTDSLHRHRFDTAGGLVAFESVPLTLMPTLEGVIREAHRIGLIITSG